MKLFNLGLPKSGTTTLQTAFEKAGLRSAHWWVKDQRRHVGRSMYRNYFEGKDPLAHFVEYDVVTQADFVTRNASFWPQMDPAMLRSIREHHPELRFFMLTRDIDKVVSSIMRWDDYIDRMKATGAPGLPGFFADSPAALKKWVENHYANIRLSFADDPGFVELDIEDPDIQAKVSDLVGVKLDWWGVANTNTKRPAQAAE